MLAQLNLCPSAVIPRACGVSSTPRPFGSIIDVPGILVGPVEPGDDRKNLAPSLRANGSRERAPDDRLREAIQNPARDSGLLRRSAPRNDVQTQIRIPAACCARVVQ